MSNEASERPVSFKQFYEAVRYVLENLWDDEQNRYWMDRSEHGPMTNCFEQFLVMSDWLRAKTKRRPVAFEVQKRFGGFKNFETCSVHHWLLADNETREWWQSRLEHLQYYFGEPDQGDGKRPEDGKPCRVLAVELEESLMSRWGVYPARLREDLIRIALSEVAWDEVAAALVREFAPGGKGGTDEQRGDDNKEARQ